MFCEMLGACKCFYAYTDTISANKNVIKIVTKIVIIIIIIKIVIIVSPAFQLVTLSISQVPVLSQASL